MGPSNTVTTLRREAACFSHGPQVSLLLATAFCVLAQHWLPCCDVFPGHVHVHLCASAPSALCCSLLGPGLSVVLAHGGAISGSRGGLTDSHGFQPRAQWRRPSRPGMGEPKTEGCPEPTGLERQSSCRRVGTVWGEEPWPGAYTPAPAAVSSLASSCPAQGWLTP